MKTLATTVTLLFLIGARTAAAQDVRYDFHKDKDFSKFKTYKYVPIKGADDPDGLTVKQLVTAMDAELAKKGFTKTDADTAALYIGYQTAIGSEKQYTSYNTGWGYGSGWGSGWYGSGRVSTRPVSEQVLSAYFDSNLFGDRGQSNGRLLSNIEPPFAPFNDKYRRRESTGKTTGFGFGSFHQAQQMPDFVESGSAPRGIC